MRTKRLKMVGAATAGALALSVTGLAGTAHADLADDLQIMAGNIPAAVDAVVEHIQTAVETYQSDPYGYPTYYLTYDVLDTPKKAVEALASGTEQFGSLGLGVGIISGSPMEVLWPYLVAFDEDPSTVLDQFHAEDITVMVGNLPTALAAAAPWVLESVAEGLQGNLTHTVYSFPGADGPALVGSNIKAFGEFLNKLTANTPSYGNGSLAFTFSMWPVIAAVATAEYVQQAEDGLAPLFEALAPLTTPIAEALAG